MESNVDKRKRIETKEYLESRFHYNPGSGDLVWKVLFPGSIAGTKIKGCIKVALERLDFKAHRLCWTLYHGTPPDDGFVIDHVNGDPHDNSISNLRLCSQRQNSMNSKRPKNNTSGYKGVAKQKGTEKYRAFICVGRRQIHLGLFSTPVAAHEAYKNAAVVNFGKFACLDR